MKRRSFLKTTTASAAGVLMSGLPSGWVGSVYADDSPGHSVIAAMDPVVALGVTGNTALQPLAEEVKTRLIRALDALDATTL